MLEVIRHSLGFCGEAWHPNFWTFIVSGFGLMPALSYLKIKSKQKI